MQPIPQIVITSFWWQMHTIELSCTQQHLVHDRVLRSIPMLTQGDEDKAELEALAKRSADGVIHFNPQLFERYAVGKRRPYSLIFFLTAAHLQDKTSLGLRPLRKQYGLLAKVRLMRTLTRLQASFHVYSSLMGEDARNQEGHDVNLTASVVTGVKAVLQQEIDECHARRRC